MKNPAMDFAWDEDEAVAIDAHFGELKNTAKECYFECRRRTKCEAFTWKEDNSCRLFSSAGSLRKQSGAISGVSKSNQFDCSGWQGAVCVGGVAWESGASTTQVIRTLDACNPTDKDIPSGCVHYPDIN